MVRSPTPARQLLCVKCGRDTSNVPLTNDTSTSTTGTAVNGDLQPAGYHPFVNGDDMDSEEEQGRGVMQDERVSQAVVNGQTESTVLVPG